MSPQPRSSVRITTMFGGRSVWALMGRMEVIRAMAKLVKNSFMVLLEIDGYNVVSYVVSFGLWLFKDHEMLPWEKSFCAEVFETDRFHFLDGLCFCHFVQRLDRDFGIFCSVL